MNRSVVDRFIAKENIKRCNRLLTQAVDEKERTHLLSLIESEQRKLDHINSPGADA